MEKDLYIPIYNIRFIGMYVHAHMNTHHVETHRYANSRAAQRHFGVYDFFTSQLFASTCTYLCRYVPVTHPEQLDAAQHLSPSAVTQVLSSSCFPKVCLFISQVAHVTLAGT